MEPKVKEFLEKGQEQEQLEKEQFLISLGLYKEGEREYSSQYNSIYSNWDGEKKQYYRTKMIACEVTEEEYAEILKYCRHNQHKYEEKTNIVGNVVIALGFITIFIGIIAAIVIGNDYHSTASEAWVIAIGSLLSGLLLIVFGRISTTLTAILNRINTMA